NSQLNVYAGEVDVRPPLAPTTQQRSSTVTVDDGEGVTTAGPRPTISEPVFRAGSNRGLATAIICNSGGWPLDQFYSENLQSLQPPRPFILEVEAGRTRCDLVRRACESVACFSRFGRPSVKGPLQERLRSAQRDVGMKTIKRCTDHQFRHTERAIDIRRRKPGQVLPDGSTRRSVAVSHFRLRRATCGHLSVAAVSPSM